MDEMIAYDILVQVAGLEEEWLELDEASGRPSLAPEQELAARQEIQDEVARLIALLPANVGSLLQRLRSRGGRSVVRLADVACGECGSRLPTQLKSSVERGRRLVRCTGCFRYLVRPSWS